MKKLLIAVLLVLIVRLAVATDYNLDGVHVHTERVIIKDGETYVYADDRSPVLTGACTHYTAPTTNQFMGICSHLKYTPEGLLKTTCSDGHCQK